MKKTILMMGFIIGFSQATFAHDEGHGPKLSDAGKFGGLVSPVVKKADAKLGAKAVLVYKAELSRSSNGTARVYIYDAEMKQVDLKTFDKKATASLASKSKGKWTESSFSLEQKEGVYIGQMPKTTSKPYNIDVTFKENGTELLSAFDNLD